MVCFSGHSTKRKILHAPDLSEDVQTATEEAINTKKARYSDSFSENVYCEQTPDQDNSEEIQEAMQDNTIHVKEAGYSEYCEVIADADLIPNKPAGSLLMSADECETDLLLSSQTRSNSLTNSAANVKSQSTAVKSNRAKDNIKTLPPTEHSKDIDNVKTLPPTERRMTRSSRKIASCGGNLEVVKSAVCGKDFNFSAQKITSDFQTNLDKNTTSAKWRNNCKKTKSSEKTVATKAIDRQKPDESPHIKNMQEELHNIAGISSLSTQKHLVNEETTSDDDDDSDDAFDDVDDKLSADNNGKVAAVETDSLADKSHSLTSLIQTESRATDQSSASPEKTFMDRNQSSYSTGDEAVGDSVSRNPPHTTDSTVQFNIKSELLDKGKNKLF